MPVSSGWGYYRDHFGRITINPLVIGATLLLVAAGVLGAEFFAIEVSPVSITIDRMMLGGLVLFFVAQVYLGYEQIRPFNRTDVLIISLMLLMTFSTFSHDWRYYENLPISRFLFYNLLPVSLYFIVRNAKLQIGELQMISLVLIAFGLYLALTGIAEVKEVTWAIFPKYIADPEYVEFLGRARGPFLNPVTNGIFMVISFACMLAWWPNSTDRGKAMIFVLSPIFLVGIYATMTRSVWLTLILAVGVVSVVIVPRRLRGGLVICGLLAGLIVGVLVSDELSSFKRDRFVSEAEMQQSATLRPLFAVIAVRMLKDRPIMGHGFGQYTAAKMAYLQDPTGNYQLAMAKPYMQHNLFLSYLTELGIVGTMLLTLLLFNLLAMAIAIWNNRRRYLIARQFGLLMMVLLIAHITNGMFHDVSIAPVANMLLYFFAGLITNLFTAKSLTEMSEAEISRVQMTNVQFEKRPRINDQVRNPSDQWVLGAENAPQS